MTKLGIVSSSPFLIKEGGAEKHVWEFLERAKKEFELVLFPTINALLQVKSEEDREILMKNLDFLDKKFLIQDSVKNLFENFYADRRQLLLNYINLNLHERLVRNLNDGVNKVDFLFSPNFLSPEVGMFNKPYGILVNGYLAPLYMNTLSHAIWKSKIGQEPIYKGLPKSIIVKNYWKKAIRKMLTNPPKFIAGNNKIILESEIAKLPSEKVIIDPGFAYESDLKFVHDKEDYAVFMSARLTPSKGIYDILRVWRRINKTLIIMGRLENYEKNFLRLVKKMGLDDRIEYKGFVRGEEKERILGRAKVLVYPTHDDTNSLTILESLFHGTPVVSYDIQGIRYVYQSVPGVELVKEFNYEEMSKRVLDYMEDRRTFPYESEELKKFLLNHSSWDRVIAQEIEIIKKHL
ncbi:LPS biosynthesis protein [Sulfolobus acidocaldarius SUSAZ]|nr:LPS biosynthesis protein [Sulfolobus acidocaldarius SUSAZ]